MFTQKDRVELEEVMDCNKPIESKVVPRWQRKALAAKAAAAQQLPKTPSGVSKRITGRKTPLGAGSRSRTTPKADRFIPNRAAMDFDASRVELADGEDKAAAAAAGGGGGAAGDSHRVLALSSKAPAAPQDHQSSMKVLYAQQRATTRRAESKARHIPSAPERMLDAPEMVDDYYLNLLSWSGNNKLAVALGPTVYLWDSQTCGIEELLTLPGEDDTVTSVSWIQEGGSHLAVGTDGAEVQLWDCAAMRRVRSMKGHADRVSALAWNKHTLSSGGRDASILNHDVRVKEHHVGTLKAHQQEVCALRWNADGTMLASGGNDNLLCIWDAASCLTGHEAEPMHRLTAHQAAVKAMAWCPWQRNTLATGAGTADRHLRFWNARTGAQLSNIDTGAQVSGIVWSRTHKELVTSHGFSQNQLCVWKYPSLAKVKELRGHTARILHLEASPCGTSVVSAGADETLRFWRVFGQRKELQAVVGGARAGKRKVIGRTIR